MRLKKLCMVFCLTTVFNFSYPMDSNIVKDSIIGCVAGVAEVAVDQPLVYIKNMVQQGKKITLNPLIWWRGAGVNAASLAPITAMQVATTNALLKGLNNKQPSGAEQTAAAFTAGALSGLVSGPAENVMLHQQNSGNTVYNTTKTLLQTHGMRGLYRGVTPAMLRDGGFTAGYMGLLPMLKKQLEKHTSMNEPTATLASGVGSGLVVGVVTHPFDRVKTYMQATLSEKESMATTFANVYRNESLKGLFKGLAARSTRVSMAVTIMGTVTDKLNKLLKKQEEKS